MPPIAEPSRADPPPLASLPVPLRPFRLVPLVILAALLGYGLTRLVMPPPPSSPALAEQLAWLSREFELQPEQVEEIARLQTAYEPICAEHCAAVAGARRALDTAATPEQRAAAEAELARLEKICDAATRGHLRAVAAVLPPEQAARFLAMMEPHLVRRVHQGPPALDGRP